MSLSESTSCSCTFLGTLPGVLQRWHDHDRRLTAAGQHTRAQEGGATSLPAAVPAGACWAGAPKTSAKGSPPKEVARDRMACCWEGRSPEGRGTSASAGSRNSMRLNESSSSSRRLQAPAKTDLQVAHGVQQVGRLASCRLTSCPGPCTVETHHRYMMAAMSVAVRAPRGARKCSSSTSHLHASLASCWQVQEAQASQKNSHWLLH